MACFAPNPRTVEPVLLDLHNHPFEAMGVARASDITEEHLYRLDAAAVAAGLGLVAVTEHGGWSCGIRAAEIAAELGDLQTIILPGQEDWCFPVEVVEVRLLSGAVFRFLSHPGMPAPFEPVWDRVHPGLHGIEVDNTAHRWHLDVNELTRLARDHDLMPIRTSDAHDLADLGRLPTEGTLEELEAMVAAKPAADWRLSEALK